MYTYYFHGKTLDGYRYTIAGKYDTDDSYASELVLGISLCSANDHFRKDIGRVEASKRIEKATIGIKQQTLYFQNLEKAAREVLGYGPEDFSRIKIFVTAASRYNLFKRKQLMKDFNLLKLGTC
jgi:hypothetical protein